MLGAAFTYTSGRALEVPPGALQAPNLPLPAPQPRWGSSLLCWRLSVFITSDQITSAAAVQPERFFPSQLQVLGVLFVGWVFFLFCC